MRLAALTMAALLALPPAASACGIDSDCMVGDRAFRIAMPEQTTPRAGAVIYMHGYRGSAKGAMRNKALIAFAHERGMALVAARSAGDDWQIPGVPSDPGTNGARELAYFDTLIETLGRDFGIDTNRLIATGFSTGGMMTWTLACHRGESFAAFVPISGTFWDPVPTACPSPPVTMVHVHGLNDPVVPLAGRKIASTRQGNVLTAIERAKAAGDFGAAETAARGPLTCEEATNPQGKLLAFCTHPGRHSFAIDYLDTAWDLLGPHTGL